MNDPRKRLCDIAQLIYDRKLTDSAGGNMSVRQDGRIYCTPKYAGSKRQWRLSPEEIVVTDMEGRQIEGTGEISREFDMHLSVYRAFPKANGICHAHAEHALLFASMKRPITPTSEMTDMYGVIELCEERASHTPELAITVVETLKRRERELDEHAIACLLPRHGITVVGADLDDAYDALERLDGSARILLGRAVFELLEKIGG